MKRIGLFVIVFFCISLLLHASGPRVLFIGDSITDGNWGNACGMPKPTAERSLWDMNHIYGSGYMYLCASHYQGDFPEKEYAFFNRKQIGVATSDSPAGPFTDLGRPVVTASPVGGGQQIDVDVFTDPVSGKSYLYWGNGYMAGAELNDDMEIGRASCRERVSSPV